MVSVVDKVNAGWKDLLEPWGGAADLNADAADRAVEDRPVSSAFGIGAMLVARADAGAESRLAADGLAAARDGQDGMQRWASSVLAPRANRMGFDVNVMNESNAPFSKGLIKRWEWVKNEVVARMPLEARQAYEAVLNARMRESLQETMFNDEANEEYAAVEYREFSATGQGREVKAELTDATRKRAVEHQKLKAEVDEKAPGGPLATINRWAAIASGQPDPEAHPAKLALKGFQLGNPGFVGFDLGSSNQYFGEKLDASQRVAAQYAPELRTGITAALMGARHGQRWLISELGYDFQTRSFAKLEGAAHPHADSVVKRWDGVKSNQLARMPAFLQERFDKYANGALRDTLGGAMKEDKKIGKYGDVKTHLYSSKGEAPEYRFWLNSDGSVGAEAVPEKQDCITQIILPLAAAVLMIIPGMQGFGAALASVGFTAAAAATAATTMYAVGAGLSVGMAVDRGIETGDWLGAVGSVAGAAIGYGGIYGAAAGGLGSAVSSVGNSLGMSASTISNVTSGIKVLNDTVAPIARGAYGLYQGIEHGSPWAALSGVGGMLGGVSHGFGDLGDGLGKAGNNMAGLGGAVLQGTAALGNGVETGNPFSITSGALSFASLAAMPISNQMRADDSRYALTPSTGPTKLDTGLGLAQLGNGLASQAYGAVNGRTIVASDIVNVVTPSKKDSEPDDDTVRANRIVGRHVGNYV